MMKTLFISISISLCLASGAFGQALSSLSEKQRFELAAAYSNAHNGVGMLVMKGDAIVFGDERVKMNLPWILASGTKSFSGVMCAAAIEDKLISGFDEKVSDTITEWKSDARKSKVTIRQLLSLTSGIDAGENLVVPTFADATTAAAKFDPGTHFEYGPNPFQIFGEVMTRKLKAKNETVAAYLKRRILDPIGMNVSSWRKFEGQPLLPQGVTVTAREWVKFGLLLKDRGKWKGKQVVSAKLVDELIVGSKVNPAYGLTFWLNADGIGPSGSDRTNLSGDIGAKKIADKLDIFMAAGAGNQRLYVIRSLDLVVVRFGIFGDFDDREFISKLVTGK